MQGPHPIRLQLPLIRVPEGMRVYQLSFAAPKFRGVTLFVCRAPFPEPDGLTRDRDLTDPLVNTQLPALPGTELGRSHDPTLNRE
jgi:hypothetical protein